MTYPPGAPFLLQNDESDGTGNPPTQATENPSPYVCMLQNRSDDEATKKSKRREIQNMRKANAPGECVSMDQIESRTPGFIGVLRGFISKKRYTCATIFVDHYSGFTYVHLQTSTNMDETLKTKVAFEAYTRSLGVKIRHYHPTTADSQTRISRQQLKT